MRSVLETAYFDRRNIDRNCNSTTIQLVDEINSVILADKLCNPLEHLMMPLE